MPTAKPSTLPANASPSAAGQRRVRGDDVLGPLGRLGAVGEQRHARALDPHHGLHERRAHVGELDEVLGPHLDVRAAVEQQERAAGHGHEHGERWPVDPARAFHVKQAGRERGAGRAAGDERVGAAVGDRAHRLHDRGVGRGAHRARRVGGLRDRDRGVDDLDPGRRRELGGGPEDEHAHVAAAAASAAPRATSAGPASAPFASSAIVSCSAAIAAASLVLVVVIVVVHVHDLATARRSRSSGTPGAGGAAGGTAGTR